MIGGLLGVDTSTSVWTPDELDDPVIKGATGAHAGSAIVPQKVIDKYEKAKNDCLLPAGIEQPPSLDSV